MGASVAVAQSTHTARGVTDSITAPPIQETKAVDRALKTVCASRGSKALTAPIARSVKWASGVTRDLHTSVRNIPTLRRGRRMSQTVSAYRPTLPIIPEATATSAPREAIVLVELPEHFVQQTQPRNQDRENSLTATVRRDMMALLVVLVVSVLVIIFVSMVLLLLAQAIRHLHADQATKLNVYVTNATSDQREVHAWLAESITTVPVVH